MEKAYCWNERSHTIFLSLHWTNSISRTPSSNGQSSAILAKTYFRLLCCVTVSLTLRLDTLQRPRTALVMSGELHVRNARLRREYKCAKALKVRQQYKYKSPCSIFSRTSCSWIALAARISYADRTNCTCPCAFQSRRRRFIFLFRVSSHFFIACACVFYS